MITVSEQHLPLYGVILPRRVHQVFLIWMYDLCHAFVETNYKLLTWEALASHEKCPAIGWEIYLSQWKQPSQSAGLMFAENQVSAQGAYSGDVWYQYTFYVTPN